ncbi:serine/threonine-protein kinase RIO1-like [Carassius auratus]|uniref:Serine/threonine-protein kinase RIO1-like n=1 Tax=Carassius auratus TaxID=7957 RepID=A0A6P6JT74_CARAU|nr:serine/threonine-protein kinase RIO1-like [Carassius auratus]
MLSLENQLHKVTLQTFKNYKQGENEDYDDDGDDDDEWDWNESGGGDFTKCYTALRAGNNPQAMEIATERTAEDRSNQDKVDEEILYQTVTGLRKDLSGVQTVPSILEDSTKGDSSSSEGEEEEDDDTGEGGRHTEEAQLDRKVANGNGRCCNR